MEIEMKKKIGVLAIAATVALGSANIALAKPDAEKMKGAGHHHEMEEAKDKHHDKKDKMRDKAKTDADDEFDRHDDEGKFKGKEKGDMPSGLAKQREKKAGQEQKELGKGSEQGQASREEHSRKWWKFWGE